MFKWAKTNHKTSGYEPKTPKLSSVQLPDERYTPISHHHSYAEKPRNSFLRRFTTPDRRATTPMYDSWQPSHDAVPSGRSRVRTMSTPVRELEAPRPIRPHPSQGPFIPVTEKVDRIRIDPSRGALAPVGVPSAAYLEEQLRRERPELAKFTPSAPAKMLSSEYERERSQKFTKTPSKAWLEDQEEQLARRSKAPSAPPIKKNHSKPWADDDDDLKSFKPVPVVDVAPEDMKLGSRPLKSALKKTSSIKPPIPQPVLKARQYDDSKAYYSENETDKRRSSDWIKPIKVVSTPSKAFLEEQREKMEEMKMQQRGWTQNRHHSYTAPRPVHEFPSSTFQHTHSSSTGSPTESVLAQEYQRSRRGSYNGGRPKPSNYMPAYIKDSQVSAPFPEATPNIEWPLVEYAQRRHRPEPLVYFDAGFSPRYPKYEVCANRGGYMSPLAPEERNLLVSNNTIYTKLVITNRDLADWPIVIETKHGQKIRVIDVFRAIYETYAVPLTKEELARWGPEYIQRCERAFLQRCKDAPEATHFLERQGMTRIDLLRGRRIFKGLVYNRGSEYWKLELLFDEGPFARR